jgi:hypothetical protein
MIMLSCYYDNVIMLSWQRYHILFSWKLHTLLVQHAGLLHGEPVHHPKAEEE